MFGDDFEVLVFYVGSALHTLKCTCDLLRVHASSLRVTQPDCQSVVYPRLFGRTL